MERTVLNDLMVIKLEQCYDFMTCPMLEYLIPLYSYYFPCNAIMAIFRPDLSYS